MNRRRSVYLKLIMSTVAPSSLAGVTFESLASTFGTPLYLYDASTLEGQVNALRRAFENIRIKYAAKALTNISILHYMKELGVGVDVVSLQEAQLALIAGFRPADIMFTPNCVSFKEIMEGVELGLTINLDNLPALEKFGATYGASVPCVLRINPDILAGGNYKISTGHSHSKFGISIHQLDEIRKILSRYSIQLHGLHIHTGSEIADLDVFMKMADILFGLAREFSSVRFLDFGGGLKVAYRPGDPVTDIDELGRRLTIAFRKFSQEEGRDLELWMEPGKFLVSEAGFLLVRVNVIKQTPRVTFVGVDSGLNHLIRPMMYDAYHTIENVSNPGGKQQPYTVVGNVCETDTFATDRELPEVREGDLLIIRNAGAYGYSMASNYNSRFRPAEVMILNGEARLIRSRDTLDQLLAGQVDIFK
jgi:diaminopimelate decarboxylase